MSGSQDDLLAQEWPHQLQANRQTFFIEATWHGHAASPGRHRLLAGGCRRVVRRDAHADDAPAHWSLATALSLLAWDGFAPQCLSTLVVVKRETAGWRYPLIMAGYLFGLAYAGAFVTYRVTLALGAG